MKSVNKSTLIPILIAVAIIPIAYIVGKGSAARELQEKFDLSIEEIQTTHDVYLQTMEAELAAAKSDWDLRYEQHRNQVREALLNTGVTLEDLNAVPPPQKPNFSISQPTYETIKNGMTYEEVFNIIGRHGENTFNMLDADGSGTQTFTWRWMNDEEENETMTATFEDGQLFSKNYSAFQL